MDFESLHHGKESDLIKGWQIFKRKAPELYKTMVDDPNCLKLLQKLDTSTLKEGKYFRRVYVLQVAKLTNRNLLDTRDYLILMLLHAVLKPSCRISVKEARRKFWKPTISDSQNAQIMHIKTIGELEKMVENMKAKYKKMNLKIQPFVIVIGETIYDLKLFYAYVNNSYYKFNSFLKTVDFCFKLFQVFNFQYAKECQLVWLFIQKHFFNINTAYDENSPIIATVVSSLNSIQ